MLKKILLATTVLLFSLGIVLISLLKAKANLSEPTAIAATDKEFYFSQKIHPDHILYSTTTLLDQLQLKLASQSQQKAVLRVGFARERLLSAEVLFEKGLDDLAMQTLDKAHHYWLVAASEAVENNDELGRLTVNYMKRYSLFMDQELRTLAMQMTDAQRARVDTILEEQRILREKL